ncbi:MAG: hypothetical protein KatS3mg113_0546 [Planctomycetaceae bacterium]|nr:MAG: hypothetical protein KatS3mg113_0546 [Planctomycetaceae bacterium]
MLLGGIDRRVGVDYLRDCSTIIVARQLLMMGTLLLASTLPVAEAQSTPPQLLQPSDTDSTNLTNVGAVRSQFRVDGNGLTAVVIDSGLRITHQDIRSRIPTRLNFVPNSLGVVVTSDVTDRIGTGTHLAGIIAGNGGGSGSVGMAPRAQVIPLKVKRDDGTYNITWVEQALDWVIANAATYNITVVCMNLADNTNATIDPGLTNSIRQRVRTLRTQRIPVVVPAGDRFYEAGSTQGMAFPAIIPETTSVGAVYDANLGPQSYASGAQASSTGPWRITPFSQRLSVNASVLHFTDVFAPGADLTAAGIATDRSSQTLFGTAQAAAVTTGVFLLAQQAYLNLNGSLPTVDQLESAIRSSTRIQDGDDEQDNVMNTLVNYYSLRSPELISNLLRITPPAVNSRVLASFDSRRYILNLTGDTADSELTVYIETTATTNELVLRGLRNTLINSSTEVRYPLPNDAQLLIRGDLGLGQDVIYLGPRLNIKILNLNMNGGNDQIQTNQCTIDLTQCDGGAGFDIFLNVGSTIRINRNRSF